MDRGRPVQTGFERLDRLDDFSCCQNDQRDEIFIGRRLTCQLGSICLEIVALIPAVPLHDDLEERRRLLRLLADQDTLDVK